MGYVWSMYGRVMGRLGGWGDWGIGFRFLAREFDGFANAKHG